MTHKDDIAVPGSPVIPHNREAEEAVIGAVLIDPASYYTTSRILEARDFYIVRHRWIWEAFNRLHQRNIPVDFLTVTEELESAAQLGEIGGPAYLTALINQTPTSMHAEAYAWMVKEASDRRDGITLANEIACAAYSEAGDFDLSKFGLRIASKMAGRNGGISPTEAAEQAKRIITDSSLVYTSGLPWIDKKIGGIFPCELTVIGGYPGTGKSAHMLQMARANAENEHKVVIFSLEMTAAQLWLRMACGDLRVDLNKLRSHQLEKEVEQAVILHADALAERYTGYLTIYQAPQTPANILSACRLDNPHIVMLDHLGLVSGRDRSVGKIEFYTDVARFMRQSIALPWNNDPGRAVVVYHHINRSSMKENRRPTTFDLDYAGEKDPDGVILMYRDEIMEAKHAGIARVEFIVGKSRFGWTGTEDAAFNLVQQRFFGWTPDDPGESNKRRTTRDDFTDH